MMISGFLDVITVDAERQVAWSIICSNMCFLGPSLAASLEPWACHRNVGS